MSKKRKWKMFWLKFWATTFIINQPLCFVGIWGNIHSHEYVATLVAILITFFNIIGVVGSLEEIDCLKRKWVVEDFLN